MDEIYTQIEVLCPECGSRQHVKLRDLVNRRYQEHECTACFEDITLKQFEISNDVLLQTLAALYEDLPRLIREHSTT